MDDYTPHRIVCLQPSATSVLREVGELDRVVACTKYCVDLCPEVGQGRTIVSDSWTADTSEVIAARPDLVIAAVPYQEQAVSEILKAGCRFLGLAPRTLSDVYTDIEIISGAVAAGARGKAVIEQMRREIETVQQKCSHSPRSRVFCEEWGKPVIASQRWVAQLVEAAGGEFVGEPGRQIDAEAIRSADPDVLIAAWCGAGNRVPLEKIVKQRGWTQMRAVRERRVYCISDEFLNTPAPTLVKGLHALSAAIHPELFAGADGLTRIGEL